MKISLKKAHQVQQELIKIIDSVELKTFINLSEFAEAAVIMTAANEKLIENFDKKSKLYDALYFIRDNIAKLNNSKTSINDKVSEAAKVSRLIKDLDEIVNIEPCESFGILKKRQEQLASQKSNAGYSHSNMLTVSCVSPSTSLMFSNRLLDLKRRKNDLRDEITALNLQLSFELSTDVEYTLVQEGLVNSK